MYIIMHGYNWPLKKYNKKWTSQEWTSVFIIQNYSRRKHRLKFLFDKLPIINQLPISCSHRFTTHLFLFITQCMEINFEIHTAFLLFLPLSKLRRISTPENYNGSVRFGSVIRSVPFQCAISTPFFNTNNTSRLFFSLLHTHI